jgi:DNA-binding NarL/FixJ family response regulator
VHAHAESSRRSRLLKTEKFDVILLDSELPNSRGHEGISRIKAKNPEVAIIMLTGDSNRDFAMDSVRFGVKDYLVKGEFDRLRLEQAYRAGR